MEENQVGFLTHQETFGGKVVGDIAAVLWYIDPQKFVKRGYKMEDLLKDIQGYYRREVIRKAVPMLQADVLGKHIENLNDFLSGKGRFAVRRWYANLALLFPIELCTFYQGSHLWNRCVV